MIKRLPTMQETQVQFLGWEDPLENGSATHSSIPGVPCGSPGKEYACNVGDLGSVSPWARKIPWRRESLLTPVFWPHKELEMTERLSLSLFPEEKWRILHLQT